ncbi:hypothetical protein D3C84_517650 [compost metagenome]
MGDAHLAQALAARAINVALVVIRPVLAFDHRDLLQLLTTVPPDVLARLQLPLIAAGIKPIGDVLLVEQCAVLLLRKAAVTCARGFHAEGRCAGVVAGKQVAGGIVVEGLCVMGQLIRVQRSRQHCRECGTVGGGHYLSAVGFDQLVQAVVTITVDRFDSLVFEKNNGLCRVFQMKDVADRIVTVMQILEWRVAGYGAHQPNRTTIVVGKNNAGDYAIAGGFTVQLSGSVVMNVAD